MSLESLADALADRPTPVIWHAHDADERFPGRFTAHVALIDAHGQEYHARITPGDAATYAAPGWHVRVSPRHGLPFSAEHADLDTLKAITLQMVADDIQF